MSSPIPRLLLHSPHPSPDPSSSSTWFPYRDAGDFHTNLVMILIILIGALLCALALNAVIHCFLRRPRRHSEPAAASDGKGEQPVALPTLVYSAGMKMAGAEAECAICLTEFVSGEGVRVLPRCKHGFHVKCIEGWLASRPSCPTCRTSCLTSSPTQPEP